MKLPYKPFSAILLTSIFALSCGSSSIISTPVESITSSPIKVIELTDAEKKNWGHLDLERDTIPGMAIDRAYEEIIKNRKGKKVIVAVIDSGIDIDHEDLDDVIWINSDEIPNNGKDDDNNGYIDDIHGWNFLGEAYNEQLEYVRLLVSGDTSNPRYSEAKSLYDSEYQTWLGRKTQYDQIAKAVNNADQTLKKHLGKEDYTMEDVKAITSDDPQVVQAVQIANNINASGISISEANEEIKSGLEQINERLNINLNKDLKGRTTGDDINDVSDTAYGNGNVKNSVKTEDHGTHVAGIIAAERNNKIGIDGVANNVELMVIRAVPNGDEYDKDIALAIRYAVDNGAQVINGSFGKSFSPHADWVRDAIVYASQNNVLIVHAAGNDSENVDKTPNFPDDNLNYKEVSNNFIRVGSLTNDYGSKMVSGFSNYGKNNVDIFAPGSDIYSTLPENEYGFRGGTSMAAPGVAGVAALIRSYYPKLSAEQVKQVILESGLSLSNKVIVGGEASDVQSFSELSKTGKIVNAYNALILASKIK